LYAQLYHRGRATQRDTAALNDALVSFRGAAQALPDGVVTLNAQDQIVWCNPQAEQHLNLRLEKDVGQNVANLVRAPDFQDYLSHREWGKPVQLRMRHPGQRTERVLSLQLVAYGDHQKLLLSRDITRFERLETTRRDFVANVSHELKTPLTVLMGFLETINESAVTPQQRAQYMALMQEQAARMQRLVDDLLTLSALEATTGPREDTIDATGLFARIEETARQLSNGAHVLTFDVEPGTAILGSESELTSAFTNLVTNAIRYTPEHGSITVRWHRLDDGGAALEVSDTGIGIPAQHLPRLTERFYRVDRSRSRQSGGTGLGLAIVKHVLTRHHGVLQIASEVGSGSTFTASLPAERIAATGTFDDEHAHGDRHADPVDEVLTAE
jgi:two-component system phosphate regulon sensor histidine kinase PhoR